MDFEQLLDYLDLEDPRDFIYFEALADLFECEEEIDDAAVHMLLKGADSETVSGLLEDYFEELLNGLPDNSGEIYSLLHQIKMSLMGMVKNAEDEDDIRRFSDEMCRFMRWYSRDSRVELTPEDRSGTIVHNMRDAVTASRLEKLGGEQYEYDFEGALDYDLDSYTMSFADLVASDREEENSGMIEFDPAEGFDDEDRF